MMRPLVAWILAALLTSTCLTPAASAATGPSFSNCGKKVLQNPHWSKNGATVVAKIQVLDCPGKCAITYSAKLFRCEKDPVLDRAWLYDHCKTQDRVWSTMSERQPFGPHHSDPMYVPKKPNKITDRGYYWAVVGVIGITYNAETVSWLGVRQSRGRV
jgi:hypothetical protein